MFISWTEVSNEFKSQQIFNPNTVQKKGLKANRNSFNQNTIEKYTIKFTTLITQYFLGFVY